MPVALKCTKMRSCMYSVILSTHETEWNFYTLISWNKCLHHCVLLQGILLIIHLSHLSALVLSCLLSLSGLSAPLSRSGFAGHSMPSMTRVFLISASLRALMAPFLHRPLTKLGLAICCNFITTSGILCWAIAHLHAIAAPLQHERGVLYLETIRRRLWRPLP